MSKSQLNNNEAIRSIVKNQEEMFCKNDREITQYYSMYSNNKTPEISNKHRPYHGQSNFLTVDNGNEQKFDKLLEKSIGRQLFNYSLTSSCETEDFMNQSYRSSVA